MSNTPTTDTVTATTSTSEERIIGSLKGNPSGPTVILIAGMHGNEQAGVEAVKDLITLIEDSDPQSFYGNMLALRANVKALKQNVRYINEDMNRMWFPSIIEQIRNTSPVDLESSERIEIKHLLKILDEINIQSDASPILADIHSFSAEGDMFTITNKNPKQTKLLSQMHVPMVFGIEKTLRGTALGYYQDKGFISFGLEGGQHENKHTKYNITASLMLLLQAAGCVSRENATKIHEFEQHMISDNRKLPVKTELVYQHIIEEGDQFKMQPGYKNFQPVKQGEWLASDKEGKIVSQCDGYVLMPLYQRQGNDGFFIIKEYQS